MTARPGVHPLRPQRTGHPLMAFAHGLEDSWESWQPLARRLPAWFDTVALDLPWRPGNDYRWRHRPSVAWLAEALEQVDRQPDVVVAHSYGATALLEMLCAGHARLPRTVVLICPLYRPPHVPVTWRLFEQARQAFKQHIHDSLRTRLAHRSRRLDPEVLEVMLAKAVDRVGPAGFLAVFDQFFSSATLPLAQAKARVLVIAGGSDSTLSPGAAASLADGIPGAELSFDHEFDHFCYVRRPDEVAAQLHAFVTDGVHQPVPKQGALS